MKYNYYIIFFLLFFVAQPMAADIVQESVRDRQVLDIAAQLRCAVCQSQSVAESSSDLAMDMKSVIGEQLDQGASPQEVIDYFVQRYGDYILMKPRTDGIGRLLWGMPVAVILLVALLVGWQIKVRAAASTAADGPDKAALTEQQRQRLQQLQEQQD